MSFLSVPETRYDHEKQDPIIPLPFVNSYA